MVLWPRLETMRTRHQPIWLWCTLLALLAPAVGCHSPWVQATVVNQQDAPAKLVEVTYPGGTFGVQAIAPHASYHYRFRILGAGAASIDFTDAAGRDHTATGPELRPGQEGILRIEIKPGGSVGWTPNLTISR
jgi:hypothetical protein